MLQPGSLEATTPTAARKEENWGDLAGVRGWTALQRFGGPGGFLRGGVVEPCKLP